MMCGQAKEWIAASWMGELDELSEQKLRGHLETCAECAREMPRLTEIWEALADLPAPEPGHAPDVRWQAALESLTPRRRFSLRSLWPKRIVWQGAIAMACLGLGLLIGTLVHSPAERSEMARLREEVSDTRELVAISLLRQQSATERLRGVDYSQRVGSLEPQVVSALMEAVQHDENVDVRLAAVDALVRASGDAKVGQTLTRAIAAQDSPMVQAALIDYLVAAKYRGATATLRNLADSQGVDQTVRKRAGTAVRELTQYR